VFDRPEAGFNVVVSNPPYMKHQGLADEVASYLVSARNEDGTPLYESTQTGSYDLYLPFIERGLSLLGPKGKLGYIAPSAWLVNKYGEGLRRLVKRTGALDRWIDFKSFQVFREAMTYTALQFYQRSERATTAACTLCVDGDLPTAHTNLGDEEIPYSTLDAAAPWTLVNSAERSLIEKLDHFPRLDSVPGILVGFRGIESGDDELFHFRRISPNLYAHAKGALSGQQIPLEDAIMRPKSPPTSSFRTRSLKSDRNSFLVPS
jgi:hypothetical protein